MKTSKFCAHGPLGVANVESIMPMIESGTTGQLGLFPTKPIRSPDVENVCWGLTGLIITALVVAEILDRVTLARRRKRVNKPPVIDDILEKAMIREREVFFAKFQATIDSEIAAGKMPMSSLYETKLANGKTYHATEDEVVNGIEGEPHMGLLKHGPREPLELPEVGAFNFISEDMLRDAIHGLSKCYKPLVMWAMRSDLKRMATRRQRWTRRVQKRKKRKRAARKRARKGAK